MSGCIEEQGGRYGDHMLPLNFADLDLTAEQRVDPLIQRFVELDEATSRAEMISDPTTWSTELQEAYEQGDITRFSKLRGYTDAEIAEFHEYIGLAKKVDAKYGDDTAIQISYLITQLTHKL